MSNNKSGFLVSFAILGVFGALYGKVYANQAWEENPMEGDRNFEYLEDSRIGRILVDAAMTKTIVRGTAFGESNLIDTRRRGSRSELCAKQNNRTASAWVNRIPMTNGWYEGELANGVRNGWGRRAYSDDSIREGCWKDGAMSGLGVYIEPGSVGLYIGTWKDDERDGRGIYIRGGSLERYDYMENRVIETSKMSLIYDINGESISDLGEEEKENDSRREKRAVLETTSYIVGSGRADKHTYFLVSKGANQKPLVIYYEEINNLLNEGEITDLDDLIREGAIRGIESFAELKPYATDLAEDILYGGDLLQKNGGIGTPLALYTDDGIVRMTPDESYLLLLANISGIEELKRVRFQTVGIRNRENVMTAESYDSIRRFLAESIGTTRVGRVKNDYITMVVGGLGIPHAAGAIVDLKRAGGRDPDSKGNKPFYIYDSERVRVHDGIEDYSYFFGKLHERIGGFLNHNIQKSLYSCLVHATAAVLTAASNPDLVAEITSGKTKLYGLMAVDGVDIPQNGFNEFELRTMLKLQEMFENLNLGKTQRILVEQKVLLERNVVSSLIPGNEVKIIRSMCNDRSGKYPKTLKKLACDLNDRLFYKKITARTEKREE
ncbi:MAG: hypothetical protein LBB24_00235 [Rickettsiales bacterium]|nr:hypothetical protein [Rickettsiales bacterium]